MCISEYIFSNHFSYKPIDFYGNPNLNERKRSFVFLVLFPHSPWPSLIPAPNQHWKRGGKKKATTKNPLAPWDTQWSHWSKNKLVQLLALPCCWEKNKISYKNMACGKRWDYPKSFPLFLKTLCSTELKLCSDQDVAKSQTLQIVPGWASDPACGSGIPARPLGFLPGKWRQLRDAFIRSHS